MVASLAYTVHVWDTDLDLEQISPLNSIKNNNQCFDSHLLSEILSRQMYTVGTIQEWSALYRFPFNKEKRVLQVHNGVVILSSPLHGNSVEKMDRPGCVNSPTNLHDPSGNLLFKPMDSAVAKWQLCEASTVLSAVTHVCIDLNQRGNTVVSDSEAKPNDVANGPNE